MIDKKDKLEIIEVFERYKTLRENLADIEHLTRLLSEKQEILHEQLVNNRNREKELINKIETMVGRKITQHELLEILENK
jgi:hypothetical protein